MADLNTAERKELGSDDFALPKERKYPIENAAHVRDAAARLAQEHNAGTISSADYAEAKTRIAAAEKRFGIGKPSAVGSRRKTRITIDHPQHGKIEIRHMTDMIRAVELDATAQLADTPAEGRKRVWIQMAKVGQWQGHPAGPFQMTAKTFAEIVANFKATTNRAIPIDFEHASESGADQGTIPTHGAPAQGWVVDLDNRGDQGLWALVEWGDLAAQYIKAGNYKYISPAVVFGAKDRVTKKNIGARLRSAGLTNQPFLDGMQPLAASDREDDEPSNDEPAEEPAANKDIAMADTKPISADEFVVKLEQLSADKTALATKLSDVITERDTAKGETAKALAEIVTLKSAISKRDEEDLKLIVSETIATYGDRLPTKDEDTLTALCKADQAAFKKAFPKVKPGEQHLLRDLTSKRESQKRIETTPVPTQEQIRDKHIAAGKTLEQACNLAFSEHKTLLAQARGV